jgi:putative oxidoreductase
MNSRAARRMGSLFDDIVMRLGTRLPCGIALLFARAALAGVFWRSGRSKVVAGSWLTISDATRYLFENDYSKVPLPPEFAAHMALYAETAFPVLLVAGLATRLSAAALLGMTLVIQIFVFPDAWWTVHVIWVSLCLVLITQGGGVFSLDALIARVRGR